MIIDTIGDLKLAMLKGLIVCARQAGCNENIAVVSPEIEFTNNFWLLIDQRISKKVKRSRQQLKLDLKRKV